MQLIPTIGLAKFKLHPTRNAKDNAITCVLSNNNAAFYTVTPERMGILLDSESKANSAVEKLNSLKKSIKSMHDGGLINWAVMDTLMSKLEDLA